MYTAPALQETPAQRAAAFTARAHDFAAKAQSATTADWRGHLEAQAAKYLRIAAFALSQPEAAPVSVAPVEVAPVAAPVEVPRAPNAVDLAAEAAIEAMRERGRQQRAADKAKSQPAPVSVVRDCRVQAWRRFMAIAKAAGLDCQARERMTIAIAGYLGCIIPSRSTLSAGQICEAAAAVEIGLLAW